MKKRISIIRIRTGPMILKEMKKVIENHKMHNQSLIKRLNKIILMFNIQIKIILRVMIQIR